MSIMCIWSNVSFKANVFLLIFCWDDLSRVVNGIFSSPPIIVCLSISPFSSVSVYFIHFSAP